MGKGDVPWPPQEGVGVFPAPSHQSPRWKVVEEEVEAGVGEVALAPVLLEPELASYAGMLERCGRAVAPGLLLALSASLSAGDVTPAAPAGAE